jgi:hypothetical protein
VLSAHAFWVGIEVTGQVPLLQDLRIRGGIRGRGNLKIQPLGMAAMTRKPRCMADLRLYPPFCQGFRQSWDHDWHRKIITEILKYFP